MIPLYCIVDRKQMPQERVRRGAKTCDKECQKVFRRAFLLDRKERYRKAAGLPPSAKSNSGQKNSVPERVDLPDWEKTPQQNATPVQPAENVTDDEGPHVIYGVRGGD